jgi:pyruvate kinase
MLESMLSKPRPTRAEAGDVANAVLDGSDVLMLSGETAKGDYPVNSVSVMSKIATEAEKVINYKNLFEDIKGNTPLPISTAESTAAAAANAALNLNIDLIIVLTDTGRIARYVAKYRPKQPILACSISSSIVKQMNLTRGVVGYLIPSFQGTGNLIKMVISAAKSMGLCDIGHKVIAIHGSNEESPEESNILEVLVVE